MNDIIGLNFVCNKFKRKRGGYIMAISKERKIEIEEIVNKILSDVDTSKTHSVDIVSIVKKDGFLIQSANLEKNTTGFLIVNDNEPVDKEGKFHRLIVVNDRFSNPKNEENIILKKSRFITAHEYGHFILHKKDQSLYAHRDKDRREDMEELEADYFARSLLMPAKSFLLLNDLVDTIFNRLQLDNDEEYKKNFKINLFSKTFKVTLDKASKRLEDIDVISSINC